MIKEFKDFAIEGNVVDLAIGVVIGAAFGNIVTSLVDDIIMPLVGLLLGGLDFTNYFISLDGSNYASLAQAEEAGAATLNYGVFLSTIIDFLIIALSIFIVIKQINKLRKENDEEEESDSKDCPYCLTEIELEAIRCPNCTSDLK